MEPSTLSSTTPQEELEALEAKDEKFTQLDVLGLEENQDIVGADDSTVNGASMYNATYGFY